MINILISASFVFAALYFAAALIATLHDSWIACVRDVRVKKEQVSPVVTASISATMPSLAELAKAAQLIPVSSDTTAIAPFPMKSLVPLCLPVSTPVVALSCAAPLAVVTNQPRTVRDFRAFICRHDLQALVKGITGKSFTRLNKKALSEAVLLAIALKISMTQHRMAL